MSVQEIIAVEEAVITDNNGNIIPPTVDMYSVDEEIEVSEPDENDIEF
jgi:hypothetical protein